MTLHVLVGVAAALGARIDLRLLWQGEGLDRLLDSGHADLVERTLQLLSSSDWLVATEVSFNVRGERGAIDILAFHPISGSLLVIEIKSVVPDMQAMLSGIDRKGRLIYRLVRSMMAPTSTGRPARGYPADDRWGLVSGPRPPAVNGDRDPAALTGDRIRQLTSTGGAGTPWGPPKEAGLMTTIGIDIGGRTHVAARCRDGQTRADREILRVSQDRAGFTALDAWLGRQPEPVTLVTMESSGHYWMPLASHLRPA